MHLGRRTSQVTSKFIVTYTKLFQGLTPEQISPRETSEDFFSNLFTLDVNRAFLEGELNQVPKEVCLGRLKVWSLVWTAEINPYPCF